MGAQTGQSYGAASQAQGMNQPQQSNPYGSLSQSMGGLMCPVNQPFANGMPMTSPQAQNNMASGQPSTDAMNNFMNQQRALGGGPSGSFYNNPMQQPMPQNTMQRQTNPFANFLSNRNILNQFRNPFIR